jgi:hypothetical protein
MPAEDQPARQVGRIRVLVPDGGAYLLQRQRSAAVEFDEHADPEAHDRVGDRYRPHRSHPGESADGSADPVQSTLLFGVGVRAW